MRTQETFAPQDAYAGFESAAETPAAIHERLRSGTEYTINPDMPLAHEEKYGCDIAAIITADGSMEPGDKYSDGEAPDSFVILDLRNIPRGTHQGQSYKLLGKDMIDPSVDFMIIGKDFDLSSGNGFKGIRYGEKVEMGRANETIKYRFNLSMNTSGRHFGLTYGQDGRLTIKDNHSTNGTTVTTGSPIKEQFKWQSKAEQEEAFRPREQAKAQQDDDPYGLGLSGKQKLAELEQLFSSEINHGEVEAASFAGLLKHIDILRGQGYDNNKIMKMIARDVHPDRAKVGSAEYARRSALFKALGQMVAR